MIGKRCYRLDWLCLTTYEDVEKRFWMVVISGKMECSMQDVKQDVCHSWRCCSLLYSTESQCGCCLVM